MHNWVSSGARYFQWAYHVLSPIRSKAGYAKTSWAGISAKTQLPPAPPLSQEKKSIIGVIQGVLLWADINTATPLGVWGRSVMSRAWRFLSLVGWLVPVRRSMIQMVGSIVRRSNGKGRTNHLDHTRDQLPSKHGSFFFHVNSH